MLNLAAQFATQVKKKKDVLIELNQQTESLTLKGHRHVAAGMAGGDQLRVAETAAPLLDVHNDALVDLHLPAVSPSARERPQNRSSSPGRTAGGRQARLMFEREWFNDFDLALPIVLISGIR